MASSCTAREHRPSTLSRCAPETSKRSVPENVNHLWQQAGCPWSYTNPVFRCNSRNRRSRRRARMLPKGSGGEQEGIARGGKLCHRPDVQGGESAGSRKRGAAVWNRNGHLASEREVTGPYGRLSWRQESSELPGSDAFIATSIRLSLPGSHSSGPGRKAPGARSGRRRRSSASARECLGRQSTHTTSEQLLTSSDGSGQQHHRSPAG